MSTIALAAGCFACWLFTARWLYSRWKEPQAFLKCGRDHDSRGRYSRPSYDSCCLPRATRMPDGGAALMAMAAAVAFPLAWATALVRWQPGGLRLARSARGGARIVRKTQVLAGKALELAEREALDD